MSTDDFKPLTPREQALVAGWTAEVERLREALEAIRIYARAPHNTDFAASCGACTIDACIGCLIEGTAREALEAGER